VTYGQRVARARARMQQLDIDVLCLSVGPDLPYLVGYEAMPLERLTMLLLPVDGDATLVVPRLEAPRVIERPDVFTLRPWDETEDPIRIVTEQIGTPTTVAIGDQTWARFVLALQAALPRPRFVPASTVTAPLRAIKDADEILVLERAGKAVDGIAEALRTQRFAGRTERNLHRALIELMLDAGHERANFAIVASGPNAASPHHEPTDRTIQPGDVVLCDFGGTMNGYCSDITRMYSVGEPPTVVQDAYDVLVGSQERAVQAASAGTPCHDVDAAARSVLEQAGLGDWFVHRTGHGIGMEAHEEPYIVSGNGLRLEPGHVFSIEPGVYLEGQFGLRLEDIVVATSEGPRRLNHAARDLAIVD
jgi:Xaa-Pro aminopeptidase